MQRSPNSPLADRTSPPVSRRPEHCRGTTRVIAEPTTVNLFLHIRKPD